MRIEKLELYGFTRLLLKNITHLVYTPGSPYQLILGTNGSGKSSILAELSPLPGHSSNYTKDGYKRIWITHNGASYFLESNFKTGKHAFQVDGENLNNGGTGEVQKTLVYQHFKINKEIHELMTGEIRFSEMSPTERRKWITTISTFDYSYAMGVFKRIAGRARDLQGAVKHQKTRLAAEMQNLQLLEAEAGLEERANRLREELNQLMLERVPNLEGFQACERQILDCFSQIEDLSKSFFKDLSYVPNGKTYESLEDAEMDQRTIESTILAEQKVLDRISSEYSDLETIAHTFETDMADGDPTQRLEELSSQIRTLRTKLQVGLFGIVSGAEEVWRDTTAVLDQVMVNFGDLPDNSDRRYSRERLQDAVRDRRECQAIVDRLEAQVAQLETRKRLMEEARETQCPSCKYIWREGYSNVEMEKIISTQIESNEEIARHQDLIRVLNVFIEECEDATAKYNLFRNYVNSYPRLKPLWDHILEYKLLMENPRDHIGIFPAWSAAVRMSLEMEELVRRRRELEMVVERQRSMGNNAHFSGRMLRLTEEIQAATELLHQKRTEERVVRRFVERFRRMSYSANRIEELYLTCRQKQDVLLSALRNQVIDETANSHQIELGGILRKISEKEGQQGIVRDIGESLKAAEEDVKTFQLLSQALSPNEGLIAVQLAGDIGCLVAQLNAVISSIWTYGMTILSCGLDGAELDYRFPVQFDTAGHQSSDIRRTSKGQRQVIDLAFHLTVLLYLNLRDYPLFLDEPGEGFDEQHRIALMAFVRQLMDANQHSQLFMVSHYASSHGSFTNAEVMVLDDRNITVPGVYNKHVTLG